jgi:uncharacterized protein YprB with RNaseH-like and TPR domain
LVDTNEKQVALAQQLASLDSFCFDTETTGLDANLADIVGLSLLRTQKHIMSQHLPIVIALRL